MLALHWDGNYSTIDLLNKRDKKAVKTLADLKNISTFAPVKTMAA